MTGEKGKGEVLVEDGEWDSGVVDSDEMMLAGRRIWEGGRGIGTADACLTGWVELDGMWTELEGELPVLDRRCIGWENGSDCCSPIRLSTGSPSYRAL